MAYQFQKHYTPAEARELLPQLRLWLDQLAGLRQEKYEVDQQLADENLRGDSGGELVNRSVKLLVEMKSIIHQFLVRGIQIKDPDRGLIDFPAFVEGREVFLCWEKAEDDISYWHDIDSGFSGREPL